MARALIGGILVQLLLLNPGCTGPTTRPPSDIKVLNLGTHGVGSAVNAVGTGIASVLSGGLHVEVKAVACSGPTEWLPMINSSEMDLGVLNSWDAQMGWRGKSIYGSLSGGRGFEIMLIASGHKALNGIVVAADLGIENVADLRGRRFVSVFTGSPGITAQAEAALANLGLTPQDVKTVAVPSPDAGVRAVIEGRAEGTIANLGMGTVLELDAGRGARFLSFDPSPEAVRKLQNKFPATVVKVSPGPGRNGVGKDTYLMSYDFYLVGRATLPEDLLYETVKILWERNGELAAINRQLRDWTTANFVNNLNTIPYHPGAIRFYKEKGVWSSEMELRQQKLLEER